MAVEQRLMSRKERREAARQRRRDEARRRQLGVWRRRLLLAAIALAAVAGSGYWWYAQTAGRATWEYFPSQGNAHIPRVDAPHEPYNSTPPTSGPHVPWIAPWGVQKGPVPPEILVHNLEDGGVVIYSGCEDCPDLVAQLAAVVNRHKQVVLVPGKGLSHRIVLSAWTVLDRMDEFDEARIERFLNAHENVDHHVR
ncbi:MAG TPA: DUF3105 domain-containing protein [Candidatus Methylomirabilis sp.]|jgi:hypothetical protein|nr:DUF3105 domain-containing protein [Candidatus Methylomirabilis sp.]